MQHQYRWALVILMLVVSLQLAACTGPEAVTAEAPEPAKVEAIEGSEFNRVTLSAKAAERLRIETDAVRMEAIDSQERLVVPYSTIVYGVNGETWLYTSPEELVYVRAPVTVDYIEGDMAVLTEGPDAGTTVVTVGVSELLGADTGVGK